MKVLHIGKYYPPYPGGIEIYCKVICESLVSKGIQVDIVVANNSNNFIREKINGVNVYRLPRKFVLSSIPICPKMPNFIRSLVEENNYDAIHLHYPNPMAEISYLLGGKQIKLIITHHTDASMRNKIKLFYTPIIMKLFKEAKQIIVLIDKFIQNKTLLNKFKNKCIVIPIPVDPNFLNEGNPEKTALIRKNYGKFILFIGNLSKYKGEDYLIEAMKNIDSNLVMIGTGTNINNVRKRINDLKLSEKVYLLNNINNNELNEYYDSCELFCLPSISPVETFGIVLLEAMARGKPIVSTELGTGTSWVNVNGETGLVIAPKSSEALSTAINDILKNDNLRLRMGHNAKKRITDYFTVDKVIDEVINLYRN
ncbi:MAG: glycosyltransferase [Candidatus Omnitrophota bacterium]